LDTIITTEKDAARLNEEKLKPFKGFKVLVLRVALKITKNEELLFAGLSGLYTL
jgi:tetraacyldisaccharide-1-P 4'-kinase